MISKSPCPRRHGIPTRFYLMAVVVSLTMVLAACGSGGGNTTGSSPTSTPTTRASTPAATANSATPTPRQTPMAGSTVVVQIMNANNGSFGFNPVTMTIRVGTTVIWKNMSSVPHTITSDDGQTFDSGNILPGSTYRFTFTTSGSFPYHCNIHPYMRAIITV